MNANRDPERVYELLEQFDFKELPEKDRIYVLSKMAEKEYTDLRNTIKNTEIFFSKSNEPNLNDSIFNSITRSNHKPNILIKILNQPVKFYQLAASILLIIGLYTIKQYSDLPEKNSPLPLKDTIFIQKTDTAYSKLVDTVKIIQEKFNYISGRKDINTQVKLSSIETLKFDTASINCPNTIYSYRGITGMSNHLIDTVSFDTLIKN
jgi:hypothetical protein